MKTQLLFCSACDRAVEVVITPAPSAEADAPELMDAEVVCLEIGSRCTGGMCPLGATAPNAMVRRLVRHGLPLANLDTVTATCPACGNEAEMILHGTGSAGCSRCGSVGRWVVDHVEE